MRRLIYILILWIGLTPICIHQANGQKIVSTSSGQFILINPDYTYEIIEPEEKTGEIQQEKEVVSVFENPDAQQDVLSSAQLEQLDQLTADFQKVEVKARVQMERAHDYIQAVDYQFTKAKESEDEEQLQSLREEMKLLKENRKILERLQDDAAGLLRDIDKLRSSNPQKFDSRYNKILAKANKKINTNYQLHTEEGEPYQKNIEPEDNVMAPASIQPSSTTYPRTSTACEVVYDGYDNSLEEERKTLAPEHIFSYTHPRLKPVFKTKNFLDAEAYLSRIGKNNYLVLNVRIHSKDAGQAYGAVRKGEMVRIDLIGLEKVYGYATYSTQGEIEPYSGDMVYELIYLLQGKDIKALAKYPIRNVGIVWTSGFEQYEVYDVDILQRQAGCM